MLSNFPGQEEIDLWPLSELPAGLWLDLDDVKEIDAPNILRSFSFLYCCWWNSASDQLVHHIHNRPLGSRWRKSCSMFSASTDHNRTWSEMSWLLPSTPHLAPDQIIGLLWFIRDLSQPNHCYVTCLVFSFVVKVVEKCTNIQFYDNKNLFKWHHGLL